MKMWNHMKRLDRFNVCDNVMSEAKQSLLPKIRSILEQVRIRTPKLREHRFFDNFDWPGLELLDNYLKAIIYIPGDSFDT